MQIITMKLKKKKKLKRKKVKRRSINSVTMRMPNKKESLRWNNKREIRL